MPNRVRCRRADPPFSSASVWSGVGTRGCAGLDPDSGYDHARFLADRTSE